MIDRNFSYLQAKEFIQLPSVEHHVVLEDQGNFSKKLQKVLHCMSNGSEGSMKRSKSDLARSWVQTGIPHAIDIAAQSINIDAYDPCLLKILAFEWIQNGLEHGSRFQNDVMVETFGGMDGILVSIADSGNGILELDEKLTAESALYQPEYSSTGRGFGLQGAKNTSEISFGFEKNQENFRVSLLVSVDRVAEAASYRLKQILSLQNN